MELIKCHCGKGAVNKKYKLCEQHNYERLHQGKGKKEVYTERAKQRADRNEANGRNGTNTGFKNNSKGSRLGEKDFRQKAIKIISPKKRERDIRMHNVYSEIDLDRDIRSCEGCGLNLPLSHSHLLSQNDRPDLADDELNIRLHCFGGYSRCHETWERGIPEQIVKMKDFHDNLIYIKKVDEQRYNTIMAKFEFDKIEQ